MNHAVATRPTATVAVDPLVGDLSALTTKPLPDEARNKKRADMFLALVNGMSVETQEEYDEATSEVRNLKTTWDAMEADRTSFTGPLNLLLDRFNARFQPYLKVLKSAEVIIKAKMATFLTSQQRKADEAHAAAEGQAQAERERIEAQAAELRAKGGTAKARAAAEEQAQALEQAAAVTIAQPVSVAPVSKGAGISTSSTATFELTDMLALVKFIAEKRPDLVVLLKLDEVKTRAMVKMMGTNTDVPGLRVFSKTGITVR